MESVVREEKGLSLSGIQSQIGFMRSDLFNIIDALIERNPQSDAIKVLVSQTIENRVDYIRQLVLGTAAFTANNAQEARKPPEKRRK